MTTTPDLLIRGGKVVSADAMFDADVAIKDGVIVAVGAQGTLPAARETLDAAGLHVLPGAIDVHVHFREPGYTHKEDFGTGTAAAACGGVTTVFEMPNVSPPTATRAALAEKLKLASEKAHVDFGLYGLLAEDNLGELEALAEGGAIGFKCYMGNTFGHLPSPSTGAMLEGFEIVARTGKRISLHAETASINMRREERLRASGRVDPLAHLAARPAVVAIEAVSRAAVLAEWTGARIHILHISSAEELRPLREAKARGVDITGETCPHYLLLDTDDYARVGSIVRVNPPVREPRNKEPLWAGIADGTIDMIATDHAPHTREEKIKNDIWTADCGFPGVEVQMPLMLTQVNAGRLTITDYVRLSAFNPAKIWGLFPRKGAIQPGADADIAIVDLGRSATIDDAKLHSRSRTTPWNGHAIKGVPIHTLVRGRFVMKDRVLDESARGFGRSVHTIQRMPPPAVRNADAAMTEIVKPPRGTSRKGEAA
jgi:dihydroorotase